MTIKKQSRKKPLIHTLYDAPKTGGEIEELSLAIIDSEAPRHRFAADEWQVVRRMIHTTADFSIMKAVKFSPGAVAAAIVAMRRGRPIYADSNMMRAGLSMERLRSMCSQYGPDKIFCHIADPDVADEARRSGLPRSLFAVRKAKGILSGGIAAFGNAPVALLELNRMIVEEDVRPALVIAMPVGFVHVIESKEELMSLDIPHIALTGRRGGSALAVSVIHALCSLANSRRGGGDDGQ
ncbi:MAG TPA: precorrin-8X methylmutase [Syntrophales bacterium]|nr:precorrin-8X methylmutase [Syntrophales bacterium]